MSLKALESKIVASLSFLDNPYVHTTLCVALVVYAAALAPRVPRQLKMLFENVLFKVAFFFVVAYTAVKDPKIALLISLGFIFTIQTLQKHDIEHEVVALFNKVKAAVVPKVARKPVVVETEFPPSAPQEVAYPMPGGVDSAQGMDAPAGFELSTGAQF
jgi:hypothetical protein